MPERHEAAHRGERPLLDKEQQRGCALNRQITKAAARLGRRRRETTSNSAGTQGPGDRHVEPHQAQPLEIRYKPGRSRFGLHRPLATGRRQPRSRLASRNRYFASIAKQAAGNQATSERRRRCAAWKPAETRSVFAVNPPDISWPPEANGLTPPAARKAEQTGKGVDRDDRKNIGDMRLADPQIRPPVPLAKDEGVCRRLFSGELPIRGPIRSRTILRCAAGKRLPCGPGRLWLQVHNAWPLLDASGTLKKAAAVGNSWARLLFAEGRDYEVGTSPRAAARRPCSGRKSRGHPSSGPRPGSNAVRIEPIDLVGFAAVQKELKLKPETVEKVNTLFADYREESCTARRSARIDLDASPDEQRRSREAASSRA